MLCECDSIRCASKERRQLKDSTVIFLCSLSTCFSLVVGPENWVCSWLSFLATTVSSTFLYSFSLLFSCSGSSLEWRTESVLVMLLYSFVRRHISPVSRRFLASSDSKIHSELCWRRQEREKTSKTREKKNIFTWSETPRSRKASCSCCCCCYCSCCSCEFQTSFWVIKLFFSGISRTSGTLLSIHCGYGCGFDAFIGCGRGYGYYCLCSISLQVLKRLLSLLVS